MGCIAQWWWRWMGRGDQWWLWPSIRWDSQECDAIVGSMLTWDVYNGVTRRAWSGNENAYDTISRAVGETPGLCVTLPNRVIDETIFDGLV